MCAKERMEVKFDVTTRNSSIGKIESKSSIYFNNYKPICWKSFKEKLDFCNNNKIIHNYILQWIMSLVTCKVIEIRSFILKLVQVLENVHKIPLHFITSHYTKVTVQDKLSVHVYYKECWQILYVSHIPPWVFLETRALVALYARLTREQFFNHRAL